MIRSFVNNIKGRLIPLVIENGGTGLMNPSVFVDGERILVNVRSTNYILYHCEGNQKFHSVYGPLVYMNPENDPHLKTENYIIEFDSNLNQLGLHKVNTEKFDSQLIPEAEFWGLEDGRLVRWKDKLYLCGVRRDVDTQGTGRIEMSELEDFNEVERFRIEPPTGISFCEKNWMPILDKPFHFIKWTNPLEIVKADKKGKSVTTLLKHDFAEGMADIRGGSQVVEIGDKYVFVIHEFNFTRTLTGQKDAKYVHRFVTYDKDFEKVSYSEPFSFLGGEIEFCCGLAVKGESVYLTFGFQDNAAFLLEFPLESLEKFLNLKREAVKFPPVTYINFEKHKDRRKTMESQLKGIEYNGYITKKEDDKRINVLGRFADTLDNHTTKAITSHLRALREWVKTDETYRIFMEDDCNADLMKYWSWDEFFRSLPNDWDCVQLSCVREGLDSVELHKRNWDDWSATAYLIKRDYAKRLVDYYCIDENYFLLELPGDNWNLQPLLENLLFVPGVTYTKPLFTERFEETTSTDESGYKTNHLESATFITNYYAGKGTI